VATVWADSQRDNLLKPADTAAAEAARVTETASATVQLPQRATPIARKDLDRAVSGLTAIDPQLGTGCGGIEKPTI
jgi:hypothetical protein